MLRQAEMPPQIGGSKLVRVSPSYAEAVGITSEELATEPLLHWIHPEDRDALASLLEARHGQVVARHKTRDAWLQLYWTVREHSGKLAVLGQVADCAERPKQDSQPEPDGKKEALEITLETMAKIVEAKHPGMMCSILLVDESSKKVSVGAGPSLPNEYNEAVEGLRIGPSVGSCGTAAFWNCPVVVEDIAKDPLWKDLRGAAKIAGVASCWSHPITGSDGTVIGAMALYNCSPRRPSQHHMDGLAIATHMVGLAIERDRLENKLIQGTKTEALGVLAGGIAHDFNNKLAAIMGNAEMALETMPESAAVSSMMHEIIAASMNAADLCKQMLAFVGVGTMNIKVVDCNDLVTDIAGLLKVALAKKTELHYKLQGGNLNIKADRSQIQQVLMNLIANASEAIGDSKGNIEIGTRIHQELNQIQLWVSDTGKGIEESERSKVFDPFFTTKTFGRGLGLSAAQGIIRRHGGAITLEGGRGQGTTFSIFLPRIAMSTCPSAIGESLQARRD